LLSVQRKNAAVPIAAMVTAVMAAAVMTPLDCVKAADAGSVTVASNVCAPIAVSGVVGIVPEYTFKVLELVTAPTSAAAWAEAEA
jgi:hypothetical protein